MVQVHVSNKDSLKLIYYALIILKLWHNFFGTIVQKVGGFSFYTRKAFNYGCCTNQNIKKCLFKHLQILPVLSPIYIYIYIYLYIRKFILQQSGKISKQILVYKVLIKEKKDLLHSPKHQHMSFTANSTFYAGITGFMIFCFVSVV